MKVYANSLISVGGISLIFAILCLTFLQPVSHLLEYGDHPDFIGMMIIVMALDAFLCIPFAYLRFKKRPIKFVAIKFVSIIANIVLNLFFLLLCPWLHEHFPAWVDWFYNPTYLVGYIFVSNLITTCLQLFCLIPELRGFAYRVDKQLLKRMLIYSFPILIFGLVGILNQTVDKIIYPFLFADRQEGLVQLGIYGAATKIAMVMAMFTQAFRYAYEPFVFGKQKEGDNRRMYAQAMKYFLIFAMFAFLVVMFYYIIVIEKMQGLLSVNTDRQKERTAYTILNEYVQRSGKQHRVHIVHRLDRDTSGLMMFAKDEKTQRTLRDNWHDIVTDRRYVAVVVGEMEKDAGNVVSWLTDRKLYVYSSPTDDGGQESITHYRTIKRANGYSLVELNLETGRKNQIRVHMQDLGHPLIGDGRYGIDGGPNPLGRLALHAFKLCFYHPVTDQLMEFETPYPPTFKKLFLKK